MATSNTPVQSSTSLPLPALPIKHATRETAESFGRNEWFHSLLVFLCAALLVLAADVAFLWLHPGGYRIEVGNYRDEFFLSDTNFQEVAEDGSTYRWTTKHSRLTLGEIDVGRHALLTLDLGGRPEPATVTLGLNGQPWGELTAATTPRSYHLLLPPVATSSTTIDIISPTFSVAGDPRQLGIKLEGFQVTIPRQGLPLPTMAHYLAQIALILGAQLTALKLGFRWRGQAIVAGTLALATAALLSGALLLAYAYLPSLASATVALALLTWIVLPRAEQLTWLGSRREIRLLWMIMLAACAIRLIGVLYPTFDGQDLGRNVRRQLMSLGGQMFIIAGSSEFGGGQTIYPTGPYIALMPGILLTQQIGIMMELALGVLEGSSAFLIAMLTRRLGGNRDAVRIAALLFLANYASFSVHVYGFSAQNFGQWFTAPLALVLLAVPKPDLRRWSLAILVLMFGVYSHIGVAILGISWMGLLLLLSLRRGGKTVWLAIAVFSAAVLGAAFFMYLDIVAVTLSHTNTIVQGGGSESDVLFPGATPLVLKGLRLAYTDIGALLLLPGFLLLLLNRKPTLNLRVPVSLLLIVGFYFAVDMLFRLQVRYFYFALPFALALIAIALGQLSSRGRIARVVVWTLTAALVVQGVALWFETTFGNGFISMTPLTH